MKNVKLISLALTMLICFLTTAQEKRISGTVTDKSKAPLPGVSIMVQKSKKATQTDFEGHYAIQAQPGDVLIFSYIGFKTENSIVREPNIINVMMQENSNQLQDVLVVGYGSSEYEDNSYSRPERKSRPVKASKVKAVSVQTSANYVQAAPNQNSVIRGVQSVSAKDEPLYIIDGMPVRSN
ncbi:MAG: carboxypeptidase-like regulatory domain-containing protein, partial [Flavobacterium sp.]